MKFLWNYRRILPTNKNLPTIYKACPSESGTDKFMQRFI